MIQTCKYNRNIEIDLFVRHKDYKRRPKNKEKPKSMSEIDSYKFPPASENGNNY